MSASEPTGNGAVTALQRGGVTVFLSRAPARPVPVPVP